MTTQFSCIKCEENSWENILAICLSEELTKKDDWMLEKITDA